MKTIFNYPEKTRHLIDENYNEEKFSTNGWPRFSSQLIFPGLRAM